MAAPSNSPRALKRARDEIVHGRQSRYFDGKWGRFIVKVLPGYHYVTARADELVATTLGSCVAACIRDPQAGLGGLNHFMLPGDPNRVDWAHPSMEMRYGQNAMERLINDILREGGRRERLEIKVFGGGNVLGRALDVGDRNADFVLAYLKAEGLKAAAKDLGGAWPRRVVYDPKTGKVDRLLLRRDIDRVVVEEEKAHQSVIAKKGVEAGEIELFD